MQPLLPSGAAPPELVAPLLPPALPPIPAAPPELVEPPSLVPPGPPVVSPPDPPTDMSPPEEAPLPPLLEVLPAPKPETLASREASRELTEPLPSRFWPVAQAPMANRDALAIKLKIRMRQPEP